MRNKSKFILGMAVAASFGVAMPSLSRAAMITVSTSGGATTDRVFTVTDPDVGTYTVTVSGGNRATGTDGIYFRNSSSSDENDATIQWTVSGLDPSVGYISAFSLGTTKITPGVGSGSTYTYVTTLSGTDENTSSTVQASQTFKNAAGPFALGIGDASTNFGSAPVFSLLIDEQVNSTRTIGTRDFTITAVAGVPEPASLSLLALMAPAVLRRRSRGR